MPLAEVTYAPTMPEPQLRELGSVLPHLVSLAVECPEEPYDGELQPGDVEVRCGCAAAAAVPMCARCSSAPGPAARCCCCYGRSLRYLGGVVKPGSRWRACSQFLIVGCVTGRGPHLVEAGFAQLATNNAISFKSPLLVGIDENSHLLLNANDRMAVLAACKQEAGMTRRPNRWQAARRPYSRFRLLRTGIEYSVRARNDGERH